MSFLKEVLRGIAIGVANIIPGVSGGTMMVSMGIYGDVIGAVTGMPKHFWKSVKFLLPYAIGMLIGIGGLSFAIGYFFLEFPFETAMLFIGLIFGGVPLLLPKIMGKRITFSETLLFVLFFWSGRLDAVLETGNRCCLRAGNKKQYLAVCGWNGSCGNDGDSRGQWFNAVDVSGILYTDHKQNQRFFGSITGS